MSLERKQNRFSDVRLTTLSGYFSKINIGLRWGLHFSIVAAKDKKNAMSQLIDVHSSLRDA